MLFNLLNGKWNTIFELGRSQKQEGVLKSLVAVVREKDGVGDECCEQRKFDDILILNKSTSFFNSEQILLNLGQQRISNSTSWSFCSSRLFSQLINLVFSSVFLSMRWRWSAYFYSMATMKAVYSLNLIYFRSSKSLSTFSFRRSSSVLSVKLVYQWCRLLQTTKETFRRLSLSSEILSLKELIWGSRNWR